MSLQQFRITTPNLFPLGKTEGSTRKDTWAHTGVPIGVGRVFLSSHMFFSSGSRKKCHLMYALGNFNNMDVDRYLYYIWKRGKLAMSSSS
jgi:hypothetical protein